MLTRLSIKMIKLYKRIPGPWHNQCRYIPTCSEYAIESLNEYGFLKGWGLALKRIARCNPLGGKGYDPVPMNKKKISS